MKKIVLLSLTLATLVSCSTHSFKKYDYVTVTDPGLAKETLQESAKPLVHEAEAKPSSEMLVDQGIIGTLNL